MKKYETIILMKTDISKEAQNKIINKIEDYINSNGKITDTNDLGVRKLVYQIKEYSQGYYYCIEFETEKDTVYWLEQLYKRVNEILKFIIVRKEG